MPVTRQNVEATKAFIRARLGNPYVYGGALSMNVKQGTDCSEVWQTTLEMVFGRWQQGRQSEGATTESYRYIPVGGVGPFGTIRVNHWRDIPANAAARLAFHHGPGGGANSHMWGELDGMRIESGGSKGLVTGDRAMAIDASYATAWAYLPGPILAGTNGEIITLGVGSGGQSVVALQEKLNGPPTYAGLDVDGEFGVLTAAAVLYYQQTKSITDDPPGVAGPATLKALGLASGAPPAPPVSDDGALVLSKVMGGTISLEKYREYLPGFRDCVNRSGAATPKRINMMAAQLGHECVGFKYMKEIWGPTQQQLTYQGRMGNNNPGDGERYMGRGAIMVTGKDNYRALSQWAHSKGYAPTSTFFVDDPAKLETPQYCFLGAIWYWTIARPKINEFCDWDNLEDSLLAVTKAINGGTYGLDDRRNRLHRARSMDLAPIMRGGPVTPPVTPPPPPTQGDDELSAEDSRLIRELHEAFLGPIDSASVLRKPGEGKIHTLARLLRYVDGNLHPVLMKLLADLNHPDAMEDLEELAAVDLTRYPECKAGKELATAILADVTNPAVPQVVNVTNGQPAAPPLADNREVVAAVTAAATAAVENAAARIQPQVVYTPPPEHVAPPSDDSGTTGQRIGQLVDALDDLNINADLPPEAKAPLEALANILQTMVGSKS